MTAEPNLTNPGRRPGPNPGEEMLTLQETCRFLRVPEGTLRTGATSAPDPAASRSAATSATGAPTSSSGSPNRPTAHSTTSDTRPWRP
jgi:hypothetical protein